MSKGYWLLMVSTNFAAPSTHNRDVIKMTIPAQYVKARYKLLSSRDTGWTNFIKVCSIELQGVPISQ